MPNPADGDLETLIGEAKGLRIRLDEPRVVQADVACQSARGREHALGHVHAERGTGADGACRVPRGLPGATPDVEDLIAGTQFERST